MAMRREESKRIQKVLTGVDKDDEMGALNAWAKCLEEILTFPFDAMVSEYQDKGPLRSGAKVSIKKISMVDDLYGVIVELRHERKKYAFPLSELKVINIDSPNYQLIKDYYCIWFANR